MSNNGDIKWNTDRHDRLRDDITSSEQHDKRTEQIMRSIQDYRKKWERRDRKEKSLQGLVDNQEELKRACERLVGDFEPLQDWLANTKLLIDDKIAKLKAFMKEPIEGKDES